MSERITFTGSIASELIESGTGCVIAVFDSCLYVSCDDNNDSLFCIGTSQLVNGPINVTTTFKTLPAVAINARWRAKNEKLYIEGVDSIDNPQCSYTHCENGTSPKVIWPDRTTVNHLTDKIAFKQSDGVFQNNLTASLQRGTDDLHSWLKSNNESIPDELLELIGCGPGLTPSGDDILIGALIALDFVGEEHAFNTLSEWIRQHAPDATNQFSLAHLHAACRAMAVAPLHTFIDALFGDKTSLPGAMEQLEAYGHRSGFDAGIGALAVADALQDRNHQRFPETSC